MGGPLIDLAAGVLDEGIVPVGLPVYDFTDAAAWFWESTAFLDVDDPGRFGLVRPGFDRSWWEYRMPSHGWARPVDGTGGWEMIPWPAQRWGFMVHVLDQAQLREIGGPGAEGLEGPALVMLVHAVTEQTEERRPLEVVEVEVAVPLGELGGFAAWADGSRKYKMSGDTSIPGVVEWSEAMRPHVDALLASIGLSNCRNVRTDVSTVPPKVLAKRSRKLGRPATREVRSIRLPRMARDVAPVAGAGGQDPLPELRMWSGHIKTYDERPLFGKVRGSWWWGHHVRGAGDRVAPRSYEVGPG